MTTGTVERRRLLAPLERAPRYDETLELITDSLVTAVRRLAETESQVWLGLTGGYDSRALLAAARTADVGVAAFTRVTERMSAADRLLPGLLAEKSGVKHVYLRTAGTELEGRRELVQEHSAGHVSAGDAQPLVTGARDRLSGISFGGHGFGVPSGWGGLQQLPASFASPELGARALARHFGEPTSSSATRAMTEWLSWCGSAPEPELDWRERFHIEQRHAGWLASKEQLYDVAPLERFPILITARNYSLLLSVPDELRRGSLIQVELIRRLAPDLLEHPFNPPARHFGFRSGIREHRRLFVRRAKGTAHRAALRFRLA